MQHVSSALPALLPNPYIDHRQRERSGLNDPTAGVADQQIHGSQQTPVDDRVQVYQNTATGVLSRKTMDAIDQFPAARIGIGIAE